ncbi:MFS transporter [Neofusicoccum parvum]|uniref:MFS transporter n=1 Tax=Neofusicoccum parvum TaxID=310453 RepID=A0ACB5RYX5_9PEZI|nr:MFS transporter [Neofusicoccum parvum]
MPETLPPRPQRTRHDSVVEESSDSESLTAKTKTTALATVRNALSSLTSILRFSHAPSAPLILCFATIFLKTFALMSNHLYLQFASKALAWTIADAGYLLFIKALVSLLVLLVLPLAGRHATARRAVPAVAVDAWVARGSLVALAAGSWLVGGASVESGARTAGLAVALVVTGLVLGSAGNGITQTMRGLVAHFAVAPREAGGGEADEEEEEGGSGRGNGSRMGQLYAGIALLELAAVLTGNVAFAALFGLGTRLSSTGSGGAGWGSGWLGLPFYAAGVTFFLGFLCAAKLPMTTSRVQRQ